MTNGEFLIEIDSIIQAEPGTAAFSNQLASLGGWDSMAKMIFIAMAEENLGLTLNGKDVISCGTVADLAKLCGIEPEG